MATLTGARAHPFAGQSGGVDGVPRWTTSSFGHSTEPTPLELCALGDHLQQCQRSNRRLHGVQLGAQALHGFVAPRFVSTLALVVVLGSGLLWLLF